MKGRTPKTWSVGGVQREGPQKDGVGGRSKGKDPKKMHLGWRIQRERPSKVKDPRKTSAEWGIQSEGPQKDEEVDPKEGPQKNADGMGGSKVKDPKK